MRVRAIFVAKGLCGAPRTNQSRNVERDPAPLENWRHSTYLFEIPCKGILMIYSQLQRIHLPDKRPALYLPTEQTSAFSAICAARAAARAAAATPLYMVAEKPPSN